MQRTHQQAIFLSADDPSISSYEAILNSRAIDTRQPLHKVAQTSLAEMRYEMAQLKGREERNALTSMDEARIDLLNLRIERAERIFYEEIEKERDERMIAKVSKAKAREVSGKKTPLRSS